MYWNRSATESCSLCTRPIAPCSLMLFRLGRRRRRNFASDQKSSRSSAQALASYVEPGMNPSRLLLNEAPDSSEDCQNLKALLASSRSWVSSYIASDERALDPKNRLNTSLSSDRHPLIIKVEKSTILGATEGEQSRAPELLDHIFRERGR